jgi:hypothetical protein
MSRAFALLLLMILPGSLGAQTWNDAQVGQLVRRAIVLREVPFSDTTLNQYKSRAHGFVFHLWQFGAGFPDPPRLALADELDVEVYWEAPSLSKQRIVGWRHGTFLPTVVRYHRDHLGIVTDNYGPVIRIGEGDEVRDAIHPLSLEGMDEYDFALSDTLTLRTPKGPLEVLAVLIRPRDLSRPLVVGTMYLERKTAALVRFQFSFTPAAYRDREVEDISVVLEQSLLEERWWLPYRQQIEIRRRSAVFEFPMRSIIRGTWEIDDYEFAAPFPDVLREEPQFSGLRTPTADTARWTTPLRAAAEAAEPFDRRVFDELKTRAEELVSRRLLEGMPSGRIGTTAVSDLVRVNRVQGLAFGVSIARRFHGGFQLRGGLGYGLSDQRVTAAVQIGMTRGTAEWTLDGRRTIRDFGDEPVVSGVVNSLLAQEAAIDLGSYLLGEEVGIGLRQRLDPRWTMELSARFERSTSVSTTASPARGTYEPNPPLGSGSYWLGRAVFAMAPRGAVDRGDLKLYLGFEGGSGPTQYLRATLRSDGSVPVPLGHLRLRTIAGIATPGLPKARSFAIGGRGTLPAETFRQWGGRRVAAGQLEWRIRVPVPAVGIGPFASTGNRAILAPLLGVGWAGGTIEGVGWRSSEGARPVVGVALELLQSLLRLEFATVLRDRDLEVEGRHPRRRIRLTVDVAPEWWPIL